MNSRVPKTQNLKSQSPEIFEDKRTIEDLTVGSSWTKTPKPEVLKESMRASWKTPKPEVLKVSMRASWTKTPKPKVPKSRKLQSQTELRKLSGFETFFLFTLVYEC
jgi:hypothetical protein